MRQLGAVTGEEEWVVNFIVKAIASLTKSNIVFGWALRFLLKTGPIWAILLVKPVQCSFTSHSIVDNPASLRIQVIWIERRVGLDYVHVPIHSAVGVPFHRRHRTPSKLSCCRNSSHRFCNTVYSTLYGRI